MHATECNTDYICKNCRNEFDEPVTREAKSKTISAKCMLEQLGVDPDKAMMGGD